jgi:hypothetical protein
VATWNSNSAIRFPPFTGILLRQSGWAGSTGLNLLDPNFPAFQTATAISIHWDVFPVDRGRSSKVADFS